MTSLIAPQVSYPGVYVVELPKATRAVVGVPTSITAFLGRTSMGPTNTATSVTSFGQFEELFGSLSKDYPLTYSVQDFFNNGGTTAVIVRLFAAQPIPVVNAWEAAGAAWAVVQMLTEIDAGSKSGTAIATAMGTLPSKVSSQTDAAKGATAMSTAFTTALGKSGGALTGSALQPYELPVIEAFVQTIGDIPSADAILGTVSTPTEEALVADMQVLATWVDAATGTTTPPTIDVALLDDLQTGITELVGPLSAVLPLYEAVPLDSTLTAAQPNLAAQIAGAAYVVGQTWILVNNLLFPPTSAAQVSAAAAQAMNSVPSAFSTDALPGALAGAGTIVSAAKTAAAAAKATWQDVRDALITTLLTDPSLLGASAGKKTSIDQASQLYLAISQAPNLATQESLASAVATALDTANKNTASSDSLTTAEQHALATPQDLLNQLAAQAPSTFAVAATLVANGEGEWANGGALQASVGPAAASQQVLQSLATNDGIYTEKLFSLTVRFQPAGSSNASTEYYPFVTLQEGTPYTLGHVLANQSQYVRGDGYVDDPNTPTGTKQKKSDVKVPAGAGSASFEDGVDSGPLGVLDYLGNEQQRTGQYALLETDIFNLMVIPWDVVGMDTPVSVYQNAMSFCVRERAVLLIDPPYAWAGDLKNDTITTQVDKYITNLGGGEQARNAAIYFPFISEADPLMNNQVRTFPPCGAIAGVIARTDAARGVWKAPAGTEASLDDIAGLQANMGDTQIGQLNPLGVNCLRTLSNYGRVVWGDRTARGSDAIDDEYKYLSVRRFALYIEESLSRSLVWAVFEPNDSSLWAALRAEVKDFMSNLMSQGALYDFQVTCDATTTTQDDIDAGIVNVLIQFAPVKPAEFVVLYFQQIAGQSTSAS